MDGYFGIQREYDEQGKNISVIYLDEYGQPVCNALGYAKKTYQRDSDGIIIAEHYFDEHKNPKQSLSGQFGENYIRNETGRISQITYTDVDRKTAKTYAGYSILKRTYYRDGSFDTDMYFDEDSNPKALSKGQYGIKRIGNTSLLLDKNGRVMLCVDNVLNGFPFMVVVFGCIICILLLLSPGKASILLTAAYVFFILYETLMFRETGDARTNFVLFSYAD